MLNLSDAAMPVLAAIAVGALAYVGFGYAIMRAAMRRCRTPARRSAVATAGALLLLSIPLWDILRNRLAFDRECEQAGVRIRRAVDDVEGFAIEVPIYEGMLQASPYRWLEGRDRDGGSVRRLLGGPDDQCYGDDRDGYVRVVFDTLRPVGYRRGPTLPMGFGG